MEQKQRVIVYIDGFNFYFGLKSNAKWKKYYWLDIVKLFEMFMSLLPSSIFRQSLMI